MILQVIIIIFLQKITQWIPLALSVFFARYLAWIFLGILLCFLMWEIIYHVINRQRYHLQKILLALLMSTTTSLILQWVGKKFIIMERPFLQGITLFYSYKGDGLDSFPSGHSLVFMALAITIFKFHKQWGIFFICLAVIIGVFRAIVGVHWPLDIVAGLFIGGMVGIFSVQFIKKFS